MSPNHVVESDMIKYVCVTYDGGVRRGEITGVLLDDSVVVIKRKGNPDAKREQGRSKASNATECVDCRDSGGERWSRANCYPNVRRSDVEESKACRR